MKKAWRILLTSVLWCILLFGMTAYAKDYTTSSTNTWITGELDENNIVNIYNITLPSAGWLSVTGQGGTIAAANIRVMDMDQTETFLEKGIYNSSPSNPATVTGEIPLSAGNYVIRVSRVSDKDGSYRFKYSFSTSNSTETEPNNSFETAMSLSANNKVTGFLALNDTLDYYKIQVPTKKKIRITCTAMFYTWVSIWDKDYMKIGEAHGTYGTSESKPETIEYEAELNPGTYYIRPSNGTNFNADHGRYFMQWGDAECAHVWESKVTKEATCSSAGTRLYICTICGEAKTETIGLKPHTYTTIVKKATTKKNGSMTVKCSRCGYVKEESAIYYPKTVKLNTTSYTYNEKVKKPGITVKGSNGKAIGSSNYTVSYAGNRKKVGSYNVTIKFKGNYSGSLTRSFKINPKGTSIAKLSGVSKGFKVTVKKQTSQTTGYQIQYSAKSKFTGAATKTISKNSRTSATYKKLKAKKKYYVRVRTYKKVAGKKYYSSWSKAKTIVTK